MARHFLAAFTAVWIGFVASAAEQPFFRGLGDLPGGVYHSSALVISAGGTVIVGRGNSASGYEAFRRTAAGGMVDLTNLSGVAFEGAAAVSADGSRVIGTAATNVGYDAFL